MSGLKEEWADIVKLRESEVSDERRKEQIRERIFNNFYSGVKGSIKEIPEVSDSPTAAEGALIKNQLKKTLMAFERTKSVETEKKFEFGLRNIKPDQVKKYTESARNVKTDEIWKIEDFPLRVMHEDVVADRFEILSLADYNSPTKGISLKPEEICIFADLSPISRYMCNMTLEEEEGFIKESKKREKSNFELIHLLHQEPPSQQLNKVDWKTARKVCMGFLFKNEISANLHPTASDIQQSSIREASVNLDHSSTVKEYQQILKNEWIQEKPAVRMKVSEIDQLEREMLDMIEMINKKGKDENIEKRLQILLGIVEEKMKSNKETAANMQIIVMYQFLLEYMKVKGSPKKKGENKEINGDKRNRRQNERFRNVKSLKTSDQKSRGIKAFSQDTQHSPQTAKFYKKLQ